MKILQLLLISGLLFPVAATAAENEKEKVDYRPEIHGTIRGKFEYQPQADKVRFQVRNARFSLSGKVLPIVSYKAEIDLSDEGKIKMLDAYGRITPMDGLDLTIGQMRVPFTIDAHRSPHQQYFANRSFIAKQVGNVRDVGFTAGYRFNTALPVTLQAGLFNGSGLTEQKDFWTDRINYSAKAQLELPKGFNVVLSTQRAKPEDVAVYMYDAGVNYHAGRWHVEAEYLRKYYDNNQFGAVNAVNSFVCYDLPLKKVFNKISFLGRFDYMGDHSNGSYDDGGKLYVTDSERKRVTGGITLSFGKAFLADLRLNYEKYFYDSGASIKVSEHDKAVVELMVRF